MTLLEFMSTFFFGFGLGAYLVASFDACAKCEKHVASNMDVSLGQPAEKPNPLTKEKY